MTNPDPSPGNQGKGENIGNKEDSVAKEKQIMIVKDKSNHKSQDLSRSDKSSVEVKANHTVTRSLEGISNEMALDNGTEIKRTFLTGSQIRRERRHGLINEDSLRLEKFEIVGSFGDKAGHMMEQMKISSNGSLGQADRPNPSNSISNVKVGLVNHKTSFQPILHAEDNNMHGNS